MLVYLGIATLPVVGYTFWLASILASDKAGLPGPHGRTNHRPGRPSRPHVGRWS